MPSIQDFIAKDLNQSRFYMFTGEPGTWKSTEALSFPRPQYWFQFDQKVSSLLIPMKNWKIPPEEVEFDNYNNWNEAKKKLDALQLNCKYKTIIVDSITSVADATNLQTLRLKSGTTNKSGSEAGMRIAGISVNTLEDYKAENSAFIQTIAILKDIQQFHKANIILVAHLQGEHDPTKASSRMIVTGGKAISAKLPAYCEEVYYFFNERSMDSSKPADRYISTVHTGNDFARTTLPLPSKIKLEANKPLYETHILPALTSLKENK